MVYTKLLSQYKFLEIEFYTKEVQYLNLFAFNLTWSLKGDHAGFELYIDMYKLFSFRLCILDRRHWNWSENRFFNVDEEID